VRVKRRAKLPRQPIALDACAVLAVLDEADGPVRCRTLATLIGTTDARIRAAVEHLRTFDHDVVGTVRGFEMRGEP